MPNDLSSLEGTMTKLKSTPATSSTTIHLPTTPTIIDVHLMLLNIDCYQDILDDNKVNKKRNIVDSLITNTFQFCGTSSLVSCEESCTTNNTNNIVDSKERILRFLRLEDKLLHFSSTLLKSFFFYIVYLCSYQQPSRNGEDNNDDDPSLLQKMNKQNKNLPIIIFPRTEYGKPFIPLNNNITTAAHHKKQEQEQVPHFNVSHQYPFVGISYYTITTERKQQQQQQQQIGLDIVTFVYKHRQTNQYYPSTIDDYIQSFQSSFTPWEWHRIQYSIKPAILLDSSATANNSSRLASCHLCCSRGSHTSKTTTAITSTADDDDGQKMSRTDTEKLKEFYLRWAMKEAFTKALGLGLSYTFDSFETRLVGIDVVTSQYNTKEQKQHTDKKKNGIWEYITKHCTTSKLNSTDTNHNNNSAVHIKALINKCPGHHKEEREELKQNELWDFIFIPLHYSKAKDEVERSNKNCGDGCACICLGPNNKEVELEHTTSKNGERIIINTHISSVKLTDLVNYHKTGERN